MPYTLEEFCTDCTASLSADSGPAGREEVRRNLEKLLANDALIEEIFPGEDGPPVRELYADDALDFRVLAHVHKGEHVGFPHNHGASWAVYGQAFGSTDMTEWDRTDGGDGPGDTGLEKTKEYRLNPGSAGIFQDGGIHSTAQEGDACLIRVTGTDLSAIQRMRFDVEGGKAISMGPSA